MSRREDPYRQQVFRSLGLVGYLGFAMAVPIAAGAWLGHLVDGKTGGSGIFAVVGILLGVAAGALSAYKIIMQALAEGTGGTPRSEDGTGRNDRKID